jgi:predicted ATPase/DNA-binding XRE family transcriptional regulator
MADTASPAFGELLKQHRIAAGLTQDALAEQAGLSTRAISDLERGARRSPHKDTLVLLVAALQLSDEDRKRLEVAAMRPPRAATAVAAPPPGHGGQSFAPDAQRELPAALTPLIGREREEAAVIHLLRQPDVRLLTLVGAPGIGKTRLALQAAGGASDLFPDGITVVALAAINDPALVLPTIARTLGLRPSGAKPVSEALAAHLHGKTHLLVLDNFEQVVAAGPQVAGLLQVCRAVKLLVTSRAALHVRGEQEFAVPPLAVPDPSRTQAGEDGVPDIVQYPAVALFVQRARAVKPTFALTSADARAIAAICRRLDGLPLAIELAAARIKLLPPPKLLARLEARPDARLGVLSGGARDLPERQQTLRRAIGWSYDLLDTREQRLWRRLAVFSGGWTLEAAEAVCSGSGVENSGAQHGELDGDLDDDLFEDFVALVGKSLVVSAEQPDAEPRFTQLETLREFALERLEAVGEAETLRRRHALHYRALAEAIEPQLKGTEQERWLDWLEREHDNLRSALQWAHAHRETELGLRLAGALWWFWQVHGHLSEGRAWLHRLLALDGRGPTGGTDAPDSVCAAVRAKALEGAGNLASRQGDYAQAVTLLEESLELYRTLGARRGISDVLNVLGMIADEQGAYERAVALLEESLALRRDLGLTRGIGATLNNLGNVALHRADYVRAVALYEEGLTLFRQLGDLWATAVALNNLGTALRNQRDWRRALPLFEESLALQRELGDQRGVAIALNNLGAAARTQGDLERAAALYRESVALHVEVGYKVGVAESLEGLAEVCAAQGRPSGATRLYAAAATLRTAAGMPLPPVDVEDHDRTLASLRLTLGDAGFAAAWSAGERMTPGQVLAAPPTE